MKITGIELNCSRTGTVRTETGSDYQLVFFRTPVVFSVGGSEKMIRSSSAIIFSEGHKQLYRSANGRPIKFDMVSFRPSSADKQYAASMNIHFDTPIEVKDDHIVSNTMKNMKLRSQVKSKHNTEFMDLAMRMLLICLCGEREDIPEKVLNIPKYPRLKALRDRIFDEPMKEWSVDEICSEMHISKTYFHRLYFAAFGSTCRQDVIDSRLMYAAELLGSTDMSISQIAEQCGYDSDSYFMRQFKQHRGCTPTEYRRSLLAEKLNNENSGKKQ